MMAAAAAATAACGAAPPPPPPKVAPRTCRILLSFGSFAQLVHLDSLSVATRSERFRIYCLQGSDEPTRALDLKEAKGKRWVRLRDEYYGIQVALEAATQGQGSGVEELQAQAASKRDECARLCIALRPEDFVPVDFGTLMRYDTPHYGPAAPKDGVRCVLFVGYGPDADGEVEYDSDGYQVFLGWELQDRVTLTLTDIRKIKAADKAWAAAGVTTARPTQSSSTGSIS